MALLLRRGPSYVPPVSKIQAAKILARPMNVLTKRMNVVSEEPSADKKPAGRLRIKTHSIARILIDTYQPENTTTLLSIHQYCAAKNLHLCNTDKINGFAIVANEHYINQFQKCFNSVFTKTNEPLSRADIIFRTRRVVLDLSRRMLAVDSGIQTIVRKWWKDAQALTKEIIGNIKNNFHVKFNPIFKTKNGKLRPVINCANSPINPFSVFVHKLLWQYIILLEANVDYPVITIDIFTLFAKLKKFRWLPGRPFYVHAIDFVGYYTNLTNVSILFGIKWLFEQCVRRGLMPQKLATLYTYVVQQIFRAEKVLYRLETADGTQYVNKDGLGMGASDSVVLSITTSMPTEYKYFERKVEPEAKDQLVRADTPLYSRFIDDGLFITQINMSQKEVAAMIDRLKLSNLQYTIRSSFNGTNHQPVQYLDMALENFGNTLYYWPTFKWKSRVMYIHPRANLPRSMKGHSVMRSMLFRLKTMCSHYHLMIKHLPELLVRFLLAGYDLSDIADELYELRHSPDEMMRFQKEAIIRINKRQKPPVDPEFKTDMFVIPYLNQIPNYVVIEAVSSSFNIPVRTIYSKSVPNLGDRTRMVNSEVHSKLLDTINT